MAADVTEGVSRPMPPWAEARLVGVLWRARRLRRQRLWTASAELQQAALRIVAPRLGAGEILACAPVQHATGGFFATLAETEAGPRFVKAVLSAGREARFWEAWERGGIGEAGAHYRLLPPARIARGRVATLLVFPFLPGLPSARWRRRRLFRQNVLAAVRAVAEFNARHPAPVLGIGAPAVRSSAPVPSAREIERALKVGRQEAEELAAAARTVEAGWRPVRDAALTGCQALAHMDLGIGNVVFGDGPAMLLDFGHAGLAPVGSDLHVIVRALETTGPGPDTLADVYAAAFAAAGGAVDARVVRRNLEVCYAVRYRDLRYFTARDPDTYRGALEISRKLIAAMEATRCGGLSSTGADAIWRYPDRGDH